jgi:hypothetical protein
VNIQLSFEVFDEYLKVTLSGENPFAEIEDILKTIKSLSEKNNRARILIDAVNLSVPREMEKFYIGELSVNMFGSKVKTAILSKPEQINKFLENVVVNRGGRLYVTSSEKEGLDWLLK